MGNTKEEYLLKLAKLSQDNRKAHEFTQELNKVLYDIELAYQTDDWILTLQNDLKKANGDLNTAQKKLNEPFVAGLTETEKKEEIKKREKTIKDAEKEVSDLHTQLEEAKEDVEKADKIKALRAQQRELIQEIRRADLSPDASISFKKNLEVYENLIGGLATSDQKANILLTTGGEALSRGTGKALAAIRSAFTARPYNAVKAASPLYKKLYEEYKENGVNPDISLSKYIKAYEKSLKIAVANVTGFEFDETAKSLGIVDLAREKAEVATANAILARLGPQNEMLRQMIMATNRAMGLDEHDGLGAEDADKKKKIEDTQKQKDIDAAIKAAVAEDIKNITVQVNLKNEEAQKAIDALGTPQTEEAKAAAQATFNAAKTQKEAVDRLKEEEERARQEAEEKEKAAEKEDASERLKAQAARAKEELEAAKQKTEAAKENLNAFKQAHEKSTKRLNAIQVIETLAVTEKYYKALEKHAREDKVIILSNIHFLTAESERLEFESKALQQDNTEHQKTIQKNLLEINDLGNTIAVDEQVVATLGSPLNQEAQDELNRLREALRIKKQRKQVLERQSDSLERAITKNQKTIDELPNKQNNIKRHLDDQNTKLKACDTAIENAEKSKETATKNLEERKNEIITSADLEITEVSEITRNVDAHREPARITAPPQDLSRSAIGPAIPAPLVAAAPGAAPAAVPAPPLPAGMDPKHLENARTRALLAQLKIDATKAGNTARVAQIEAQQAQLQPAWNETATAYPDWATNIYLKQKEEEVIKAAAAYEATRQNLIQQAKLLENLKEYSEENRIKLESLDPTDPKNEEAIALAKETAENTEKALTATQKSVQELEKILGEQNPYDKDNTKKLIQDAHNAQKAENAAVAERRQKEAADKKDAKKPEDLSSLSKGGAERSDKLRSPEEIFQERWGQAKQHLGNVTGKYDTQDTDAAWLESVLDMLIFLMVFTVTKIIKKGLSYRNYNDYKSNMKILNLLDNSVKDLVELHAALEKAMKEDPPDLAKLRLLQNQIQGMQATFEKLRDKDGNEDEALQKLLNDETVTDKERDAVRKRIDLTKKALETISERIKTQTLKAEALDTLKHVNDTLDEQTKAVNKTGANKDTVEIARKHIQFMRNKLKKIKADVLSDQSNPEANEKFKKNIEDTEKKIAALEANVNALESKLNPHAPVVTPPPVTPTPPTAATATTTPPTTTPPTAAEATITPMAGTTEPPREPTQPQTVSDVWAEQEERTRREPDELDTAIDERAPSKNQQKKAKKEQKRRAKQQQKEVERIAFGADGDEIDKPKPSVTSFFDRIRKLSSGNAKQRQRAAESLYAIVEMGTEADTEAAVITTPGAQRSRSNTMRSTTSERTARNTDARKLSTLKRLLSKINIFKLLKERLGRGNEAVITTSHKRGSGSRG